MKKHYIFLTFLATLLLSSCMNYTRVHSYEHVTPTFNLADFFVGEVKAWGIVQDFDGQMIQRFTVDIKGSTDEQQRITLNEVFHYEYGDGVKTRQWVLNPVFDEQSNEIIGYTGDAGDINGQADGRISGNAFYFRYQMDLPVEDDVYTVGIDDFIWTFNDGSLINRSYIRKFSVAFAEVTIFMQKQ